MQDRLYKKHELEPLSLTFSHPMQRPDLMNYIEDQDTHAALNTAQREIASRKPFTCKSRISRINIPLKTGPGPRMFIMYNFWTKRVTYTPLIQCKGETYYLLDGGGLDGGNNRKQKRG